jgi:hypothetical protein
METPTKASTAKLRTIVAIAATSIMESRLAMRHRWRRSSGSVDLRQAAPLRNGAPREILGAHGVWQAQEVASAGSKTLSRRGDV